MRVYLLVLPFTQFTGQGEDFRISMVLTMETPVAKARITAIISNFRRPE